MPSHPSAQGPKPCKQGFPTQGRALDSDAVRVRVGWAHLEVEQRVERQGEDSPGAGQHAYDLVVIGSGPAGIHAAVQAAKLKRTVCIIERTAPHIGGALVHTGTIPSKTMREALDAVQAVRKHLDEQWVTRMMQDLPIDRLLARARCVSTVEEKLLEEHLKSNAIVLLEGEGFIEGPHLVRLNKKGSCSQVVEAKAILIATGSRPRRPSDIPFDGWRVVDSDEILGLKSIPERMLILGAGIIGCEYACIFASMGVKVSVLDSGDDILRQMDRDVVNELRRSMEECGVTFFLGESLRDVVPKGPVVQLHTESRCIETDLVFFAGGRVSNSDKLGLERLGIVTTPRGAIVVNEHFQTAIPSVYAAGDVIGAPALAATSSHQGRAVSCHAFGGHADPFPELYPVGVYTIPELSGIGKTEAELKERGVPYVVGLAHYKEIARGQIRGDSRGLIKMLVCPNDHKILGIHIVGADAANLIHIGQAFMLSGGYAQDFVNMVFNYPTLAEGYRIAAFNALNKIFSSGSIEKPKVSSAA